MQTIEFRERPTSFGVAQAQAGAGVAGAAGVAEAAEVAEAAGMADDALVVLLEPLLSVEAVVLRVPDSLPPTTTMLHADGEATRRFGRPSPLRRRGSASPLPPPCHDSAASA